MEYYCPYKEEFVTAEIECFECNNPACHISGDFFNPKAEDANRAETGRRRDESIVAKSY